MCIRRFFFLVPLVAMAACSSPRLDVLRKVDLPQDPYHATLATQYRTLAEAASGTGRWEAAQFYADKGLKAAYGGEVTPEDPSAWPLETMLMETMTEARMQLLPAISPATQKQSPRAAANALVFYDCWVEQTAAQIPDAQLCHQGFEEAMAALVTPAASRQTEVAPDIALSTSFLIFFGWDEALLGAQAQEALDKTLSYIRRLKDAGYEIVVNGHTDTSGDDSYNLTLSNARADVVKEALAKAGVAREKITTFGFGETDPRVKTPDGVREPANRRVEIFIE